MILLVLLCCGSRPCDAAVTVKIRTSEKIAVITLKFAQCGVAIRVICPKDADGMANSVDPDQEQFDLGLHCLLTPVCLKTYDLYCNIF